MRVDANALKASKKLSVPIAIAAPAKMGPAVIADEVVYERLLLLEVQVAISVINVLHALIGTNAFRSVLRGSCRGL